MTKKKKSKSEPASFPNPTVEAYREVVDSALIREVRLVESQFEVKPDAYSGGQDEWRSGYECVLESGYYHDDLRLIIGSVLARAQCRKGRQQLLSAKTKYVVIYEVNGDVDEIAALKFVEKVGRFAVYPYFRGHFAELCSQASLMVPPLPVLTDGPVRIGKVLGISGESGQSAPSEEQNPSSAKV